MEEECTEMDAYITLAVPNNAASAQRHLYSQQPLERSALKLKPKNSLDLYDGCF